MNDNEHLTGVYARFASINGTSLLWALPHHDIRFQNASHGKTRPFSRYLTVHPDDHLQGAADAAYTLIEYGDYQCPGCGRLFLIIRDLQAELGVMLRIAYRHYPFSGIHPQAQIAAETAEAAGAQGRFWEMHDLLFENQNALAPKNLYRYAEQIGLDIKRFRDDVKARRYRALVNEHFRRGVQDGVYGTPGLFINGIRHNGTLDLDTLRARIVNAESGA